MYNLGKTLEGEKDNKNHFHPFAMTVDVIFLSSLFTTFLKMT